MLVVLPCDNCIHNDICKYKEEMEGIIDNINRSEANGWALSSYINNLSEGLSLTFNCKYKRINTNPLINQR